MSIFQELNQQGTTVIIVTHEKDIASFANRQIVFKDGKIVFDGASESKNANEELRKLPIEIDI